MLGEGEWKTKKHGADYRRQWRKVHLGIDAATLEIRAMEVTDNSVGDAPVLPDLSKQIPLDEHICAVSRRHPDQEECQTLEDEPSRCPCAKGDPARDAPVRTSRYAKHSTKPQLG